MTDDFARVAAANAGEAGGGLDVSGSGAAGGS
jgi:hypothetical protein